jgi:anaerobic magnesium-protoporphyrin IX monomethyl ester cyclase
MRVLLVYPPISKEERYSSAIGSAGGRQMPLGIFYLASSLRQRGHEVAVIDGEAENLTAADILRRAEQFQPGLIGISSTTVAFHRALEVARELKQHRRDWPIVLGGSHVSSNLEHGMSFAEFDFAVVGEGEKTLVDLADALQRGSDLSGVAGLAYRRQTETVGGADIPVCHEHGVAPGRQECPPHRGERRELVANPPAPRIDDLDALPFPAYDLAADLALYTPPPCNYKKLPAANVITSRGCPNQCTFCDRSVFGQLLRQRSAENVAAEIEHLWNDYHVREIAFVDDTFTLRPQRIRELFAILDRKDIAFPWTCMSRVSAVDEDLLRFMRDHGCWHISFGIESGNEDVLKRIKKNISLEQARRVIGWCAKLGIRTKGFFIVGHPGETLETIDESIAEALKMKLDDVVVTINTPIPGSPQYKEAGQNGTLDVTDWSKFNYWRPVFVPHGLTREQLLLKHREFYRRFYFRPRILWRYMLSFLSPSGPRRFVTLLRTLPFVMFREKSKPADNAKRSTDSAEGSSPVPSPHFRRKGRISTSSVPQEQPATGKTAGN